MLPPPALPRHVSARFTASPPRSSLVALAISSLLASSACSEDTPEPEGLRQRSRQRDPASEASASRRAFAAAPDYAKLIGLLGQRHEVARALLGPHYLHYDASFYTGPADIPRDQPLPDVAVDQPIYERFQIEDRLELRWAAAPGEDPRFYLDQRGASPGARTGRGISQPDGPDGLGRLSRIDAQARVVVANDSGPLHVAAAMGKPLVALFGPT
ncbi:MAG: glycosyltransferase family 9 protein, partial [Deltaproteobacteria bacterium]|nr:glycosyltransferase family 9 protein [Deltaproteobacteria bacterium]